MKRAMIVFLLVLAAVLGGFIGARVSVHAQTTAVLQFTGSWATHTSCTITAGQTSVCLASDGLWQSLSGGAFTQIGGGTAGVASLTVNGGTAQTGAVSITIPKTATTISTTTIQ